MARTRQVQPQAPSGFVASAVRLPTSSRNMAGRSQNWQTDAWRFWESVGELRSVSVWIGNVLSRAVLVAGKREGRMLVPVSEGPAAESMEDFYGGPQGQSEMLASLGVHLTVAGEAYVTYRNRANTWNTLAAGKVSQLPTKRLQADFGREGGSEPLAPDDLVIRLWTPHPRDPTKPDSSVRPNLATLAQIVAYDEHIRAQIDSRLAGAGILFISNEVSFPVPEGMDPHANQAHVFMALLGEAMMTAKSDRADASALVPIVAMVPTESLGKNEHIKFWTELDAHVVEMRDAAIKRLALGLDVPPEVLLGVGDANHWNAWLSEESAVKAHLEPRLGTIAYAITESYLRPSLKGIVPDDELEDYFCLADTSGIRLRPNRSSEAIELYDRGELSGPALRRETGFQPEDAPADEQVREWLLRKIAIGSTTPEQSIAAFHLLGIDLGASPVGVNREPPDHLRTDTTPQIPDRSPPSRARAEVRARRAPSLEPTNLAAACDVLVYRALERVGNKLRSSHPRTDAARMPAVDIYRALSGDTDTLLAGAWECATAVLEPYTDDVAATVGTLDFYVRGLLSSRRPHNLTVLEALLACQSPRALEASH